LQHAFATILATRRARVRNPVPATLQGGSPVLAVWRLFVLPVTERTPFIERLPGWLLELVCSTNRLHMSISESFEQTMKAGECLLGLAHAIRGGITFASQAQHPILQQHAISCSNRTSVVPQLQSLASLATMCRPREQWQCIMASSCCLQQPSCMPRCAQQQTVRYHQTGAQTAAVPTLKQRLRELMMLVHPDRWSAHDTARQENERSFKLLNEYLEAAKAVGF
jgi:Domain of unknown function (DUF4460)